MVAMRRVVATVMLLAACLAPPSVALNRTEGRVKLLESRLAAAEGTSRIEILVELAELHRDNPIDQPIERAEEALRLLESRPEELLEARARLALGWTLSTLGRYAEALEHARRARVIAVELGRELLVASADYHIAMAEWYRGHYEESLEAANRAVQAQEAAGDLAELSTTLTLVGAIHRSRSSYDESLACHLRALELAGDVERQDLVARARNNIGLIYWHLGKHDKAREHFEPLPDIYRSLGRVRNLAAVLSNLALVYIELGDAERAIPHLVEALGLESVSDRTRARLLTNLGFAHVQMGRDEDALRYQFDALAVHESIRSRSTCRSLAAIAAIHRRQGRLDESLNYYNRALDQAVAWEAREEQAEIHRGLSEVYEDLGDHEGALRSLRRHRVLAEELTSAESQQRLSELEARYAVASKQREVDALERAQVTQQLELSRQRVRQILLFGTTLLLAAAALALFVVSRTRARSLAEVREANDELRKTTDRLLESELRYRSVFHDAVVPRLLVDLDRRQVIDVNEPAARLCGQTRDGLRGSDVEDLSPEWLARVLSQLDRRADEAIHHAEEYREPGGGARVAEVWASPLEIDHRACAAVTVHDATEERRRDEERIRVDKLESLGLLAGGIAHDFNNALTSVMGRVSLASSAALPHSELHVLLGEAEVAIRQATDLTSQLLTFARGGEPRRELHDVAALLREATRFALSGSTVRVDLEVVPDLWPAELDAGQFRQVVSNLVINAAQAMHDGGHLSVRAWNRDATEPLSRVAPAGPYVWIEFQDVGPGIPPEIQDKILDPYFTTKEGGSGLGLATAFTIMKRHRGGLEFQSGPGGTTFSVYFPAQPSRTPRVPDEEPAGLCGSGRVLVMDDDVAVQGVYKASLTQLGYDCEVVADGESALARYFEEEAAGRPFDVVIMDLTVPGAMGGKAAMAELRRRDPDALGMVASGYSKDPVMSDFRAAGFAGSLSKPFTLDELATRLKQVLKSKAVHADRRV